MQILHFVTVYCSALLFQYHPNAPQQHTCIVVCYDTENNSPQKCKPSFRQCNMPHVMFFKMSKKLKILMNTKLCRIKKKKKTKMCMQKRIWNASGLTFCGVNWSVVHKQNTSIYKLPLITVHRAFPVWRWFTQSTGVSYLWTKEAIGQASLIFYDYRSPIGVSIPPSLDSQNLQQSY